MSWIPRPEGFEPGTSIQSRESMSLGHARVISLGGESIHVTAITALAGSI